MYLTIDIGTSSCKVSIIDKKGTILEKVSLPYPTIYLKEEWMEQNPEEWWKAIKKGIRMLNEKNKEIFKKVRCISVTSQRESIIPVNKKGDPLYNCILWCDRRSDSELKAIMSKVDRETIIKITGLTPSTVFSASKILWIKNKLPSVYDKTFYFLQPADYIVYKLTGEFGTDYSLASRTMLFDIVEKKWASSLLKELSLDESKFPPVYPCIERKYTLKKELSSYFNLPEELPVILAGGDHQCSLLGAGGIDETTWIIPLGTSTSICLSTDSPFYLPNQWFLCSCSPYPHFFDIEVPIWTTGAIIEWIKGNILNFEKVLITEEEFNELLTKVKFIEPGAEGIFVLPYFSSNENLYDVSIRGGTIYGLKLNHTLPHIIRAIMEGISFEIKYIISKLKNLLKKDCSKIVVIGGGAKNQIWRQIIADILEKEIYVHTSVDCVAVGSAILASLAVGDYPSLCESIKSMVRLCGSTAPDEKNSKIYNELYFTYEKVKNNLRNSPVLNELTTTEEGKLMNEYP